MASKRLLALCTRRVFLAPHLSSVGTIPLTSNVRWISPQVISLSSSSIRGFSSESTPKMSESTFHELADPILDQMVESIDECFDDLEGVDDFDVSYSQGVLKLDLGHHGTWVLNKQAPNRQIWWSSPLSGPRRFEYDEGLEAWVNTRDTTKVLLEELEQELRTATGIQVQLQQQ